MAIVKMKHLRLMAMQSDQEAILNLLQREGCVEISEPQVDLSDPAWAGLSKPQETGLTSARERMTAGERALESLKSYAPEKGNFLKPRTPISESELFRSAARDKARKSVDFINETQHRIDTIHAKQARLTSQKELLAPWLPLDVPLEVGNTGEVAIQFGTVPAVVPIPELETALERVSGLAQLMRASSDQDLHYLLLVCHISVEKDCLEALKEYGWSRSGLRDYTGTAAENNRRIDRELAQAAKELDQAESSLAVRGGERDSIRQEIDRAAVDVDRADACGRLLDTQTAFFLEGWVPEERWDGVQNRLSGYACAWELSDPAPEEYADVPVKLKNNWLTWPMNMVTEMYSLPAYGSVDPNPLMFPFFVLFYGIMMADMGYGLVMLLLGGIVLTQKKPKGTLANMCGLLVLCGISTFIMGALTGGFFGDFLTQLFRLTGINDNFELPSLFTPLGDTLMILIGSMCLGMVQIITGMIISVVQKIKREQYMDALWEEVTWWIVFIGIALAILQGNLIVLAIGGIMILVGAGWNATGFGKVTAIFSSLYNHVTGYFGDILSYSRLMALMLAGSVIAQVFNTLGAIPGNVIFFLIISLVGNALNFGLNLLGCYVHDLRLQCLEYFNKFYEDGGRPFRPLERNTTYVDIQ